MSQPLICARCQRQINPDPRAFHTASNGLNYHIECISGMAPRDVGRDSRSNQSMGDSSLITQLPSRQQHSRSQTAAAPGMSSGNANINFTRMGQGSQSDQHFGRDSASSEPRGRSAKARSSIGATSIMRMRDVNQYRQELRNIIWPNPRSLLGAQDYRNRIWIHAARTFVAKPEQSDKFKMANWAKTEIDSSMREEIEMLLDQPETYKEFLISGRSHEIQFHNSVKPRLGRILSAYAAANDNKLPLVGALQVCTVLATINNRDQDVFYLLQVITELMKPYYENNQKLIRDETLILTEVLCDKEKELVQHLNLLGIDLIDMCDICRSWIQALFVHHFYMEFVLRVIDLVLLEGPSVLVTLVYGIFVLVKGDICSKSVDADVFDILISELPNVLRGTQLIQRVIKDAKVMYSLDMYQFVQNQRRKKSWNMCLELPGVLHIDKTVGNLDLMQKKLRKWRKESRAHYNLKIISPEFDDDDDDDLLDDADSVREENDQLRIQMREMGRELEILRQRNEELLTSSREYSRAGVAANNGSHHYSMSAGWANGKRSSGSHGRGAVGFGSSGSNQLPEGEEKEYGSTTQQPAHGSHHSSNSIVENIDLTHLGQSHGGLAANLINNNNDIDDNVQIREIECSYNKWALSYRDAVETVREPCVFMQGYLCKLTSRWTRPGSNKLDVIQKRWFVLNDRYLTIWKSHTHKAPTGNKCLDLRGYVIRPCEHPKADAALEVISPSKFKAKRTDDSNNLERTKFYLLAVETEETESFRVRDLWVAALKFAAERGGRLFPELSQETEQ